MFFKILICLSLAYLVTGESLGTKRWYFFKNENITFNEELIPQVVLYGPYSKEASIEVVRCEAINFEQYYFCEDPKPGEHLKTNYTIRCDNDKYENENCYVLVYVEKQEDLSTKTPPMAIKSEAIYIKFFIAFVLSQIIIGLVLAPLIYCIVRRKAKPIGQ